jgi:hypothetical protein
MHHVFTPGFFDWFGTAINIAPYGLVVVAVYWSIWWLLVPAAPAIVLHIAALSDYFFRLISPGYLGAKQ